MSGHQRLIEIAIKSSPHYEREPGQPIVLQWKAENDGEGAAMPVSGPTWTGSDWPISLQCTAAGSWSRHFWYESLSSSVTAGRTDEVRRRRELRPEPFEAAEFDDECTVWSTYESVTRIVAGRIGMRAPTVSLIVARLRNIT